MTRSPFAAITAAGRVMLQQYRYYFTHRWSAGRKRQNLAFCLEVAVAIALRASGDGDAFASSTSLAPSATAWSFQAPGYSTTAAGRATATSSCRSSKTRSAPSSHARSRATW